MIKIYGNDIWRGGQKIGWIVGNDVYNARGDKTGYFQSNDIYRRDGMKIGYIEGNILYSTTDGKSFRLDEIRNTIRGGSISDLARAAIRLLIGG
jgi:hypothetical protein